MQDIINNQFLLLEFSYLDDEDDGDTGFTTVSHSTSRDSFFDIHGSDFTTSTSSQNNMGDKFNIANNLHSKSQKLAATIQKWCLKKLYKKSKVKLNASKKILIISKKLDTSNDKFVYFDQSTELERTSNIATEQSKKDNGNIMT